MPRCRGLRICLAALACLSISPAARAEEYGAQVAAFPPSKVTAGEIFTLPVEVKNTGELTWQRDDCAAATDFRLSGHWYQNGAEVLFEGVGRTPIPATMKPGDSQKLTAVLRAPAQPGKYTLKLDMVHENVHWFSQAPDKVPGELQGFAVEVKAPTAAPKVGQISAWFPLSTPATTQVIVVPRTGACPVTVDFGDGPNIAVAADAVGAAHKYPLGKFKVTATAVPGSGCSGSSSIEIEVADTACPFILASVKICSFLDLECCQIDPIWCFMPELLGPPEIEKVTLLGGEGNGARPGDWIVIEGSSLGTKGKAELLIKDLKGNDITVPLVEATGGSWSSPLVGGFLSHEVSGVLDQTGSIRITRSDGMTSNAFPIPFEATRDFQLIPPSMIAVDCSTEVACNTCNDFEDCEGFLEPAPILIEATHQSIPVSSIVGACVLGGGSGTDHYSVNLNNQWRLAAALSDVRFGDGKVESVSGFTVGSSQISGQVSWSVDSCELIAYSVALIATGPLGVPMQ